MIDTKIEKTDLNSEKMSRKDSNRMSEMNKEMMITENEEIKHGILET